VWARKAKYGNKKLERQGKKFDSILEWDVYSILKVMLAANEIDILDCQPKVYLSDAHILYKPDFLAREFKTGKWFYIEAKGVETSVWKIKKSLWKYYGPGDLHIYKRAKNRKQVERVEIIQSLMEERKV
jgi:hypothetical protein